MLLCVASPSQLLSACPLTQILTLISLSTPVLLSFHFSQRPLPSLFSIAHQGVPYALVLVAQTPLDVAVAQVHPYASQSPKHPYVAVAQVRLYASQRPKLPYVAASQLPPFATQPQKLPYVVAPPAQQQNVVGLTYPFVLAPPSQLPVFQLSLSDQQCQPQS